MNLFLHEMNELCDFHFNNCDKYRLMVNRLFGGLSKAKSLEELPFIPVTVFKDLDLMSIPQQEVFKTLSSSGTSGTQSKIFLNRENSLNQTLALKELFQEQFGRARLPIIIFDSQKQLRSSVSADARKAAVVGFSTFASPRFFALGEDFEIDWDKLEEYILINSHSEVVIFGFTFLLWTHLVMNNRNNRTFNLPGGVILHGGGWKKLQGLGVSKSDFKAEMKRITGVSRVVDYYGMAEQAGSIFFECESGFFHESKFSSVIMRDPYSLLPLKAGELGLVQVVSKLPTSYPGHSILTQDLGVMHGIGDCSCKRSGRYFSIEGRMQNSQVRGCSDVGM
jgi:hypothetical protein